MIILAKDRAGDELQSLISKEHNKYELKHNVACDYKPFCFIAQENEEILGVLVGFTAFNEVYIDDLLVVEAYRKKGVGSALLRKVESSFDSKRFSYITLCTNRFQAPSFYEKNGYEIEFIRENNNNPKLTKYYFIKYLS